MPAGLPHLLFTDADHHPTLVYLITNTSDFEEQDSDPLHQSCPQPYIVRVSLELAAHSVSFSRSLFHPSSLV